MSRTDIHAPASDQFDPEAYACIGFVDLRPAEDDDSWSADYAELHDNLSRTGAAAAPEYQVGKCTHCGASIRYAAFMLHTPTNTYITVGGECLDHRFGLTAEEFQTRRKQRVLDQERVITKRGNMEAVLKVDPRLAILESHAECLKVSDFLADLSDKAGRYPLTEKQIAAAVACLDRHEAWVAKREAERASSSPAPSGKVEVVGTIASMKWTEGQFPAHKMLVKDDRGFKVWVTVPAALEGHMDWSDGKYGTHVYGVDVDDRVKFTCTLEPSKDDETFAFGKRPTKAVKLA